VANELINCACNGTLLLLSDILRVWRISGLVGEWVEVLEGWPGEGMETLHPFLHTSFYKFLPASCS
jgi:hypothetical protein